MAFQGGSFSGQQPTVYSGASRFHYTAVLANPNSGDVSELPARFYDKQSIPLVRSTEGYCVALSKLSIQGAAANLPLLLPPLRALSTGSEDVIKTDYTVGVRWRVEKGLVGSRTGTSVYASTPMLTMPVDIPTIYPDASRSDASSKFYWVTSLYDVMDAVNKAMSDLVAGGNTGALTFTPTGAGIWADGTSAAKSVPSLTDFVPTNGFALQDGRAPFALAYDPQLQWYSMLATEQCAADVDVPGYPKLAGGTLFAPDTYLTAYLYFNDKLLEAVPFDWLIDRTTAATNASLHSENPDRVRGPVFNTAPDATGSYFYPLSLSSTHATAILPGALQQLASTYNFGRNAALTSAIFATPQENPAFDNWRPYTGFAVTSGSIIAFPTTVGQNVVSGGVLAPSASTKINNILFEADIPNGKGAYTLQNGTDYDPNVLQWKAIKAGSDLSSVDLQLYLRTRTGDYIPWMVTNGGAITIQLVFSLQPW